MIDENWVGNDLNQRRIIYNKLTANEKWELFKFAMTINKLPPSIKFKDKIFLFFILIKDKIMDTFVLGLLFFWYPLILKVDTKRKWCETNGFFCDKTKSKCEYKHFKHRGLKTLDIAWEHRNTMEVLKAL